MRDVNGRKSYQTRSKVNGRWKEIPETDSKLEANDQSYYKDGIEMFPLAFHDTF